MREDVTTQWFDERLNRFERVIIVTKGTAESDVEKLLVPALEAFKDTDLLVVATTGGSATAALRKRFPYTNIIIEDFIPFADILPYADTFVTNGEYGGVQLAIKNEVPLVVAGMHEGEKEINARIGHLKLGIDLGTGKPKSAQLRRAVIEVLNNVQFKNNVKRLAKECNGYSTNDLCAMYVRQAIHHKSTGASSHQRNIVLY